MTETEVNLHKESQQSYGLSANDLMRKFEELLQDNGLGNVQYCTDIEARAEDARKGLGLPAQCPIWPLKGDHLRETKACIPGIHWPYAY